MRIVLKDTSVGQFRQRHVVKPTRYPVSGQRWTFWVVETPHEFVHRSDGCLTVLKVPENLSLALVSEGRYQHIIYLLFIALGELTDHFPSASNCPLRMADAFYWTTYLYALGRRRISAR